MRISRCRISYLVKITLHCCRSDSLARYTCAAAVCSPLFVYSNPGSSSQSESCVLVTCSESANKRAVFSSDVPESK